MPKCIYCLEERRLTEFNREHVLAEAFGTFTNNLKDLRCVCRASNQWFGDSLELRPLRRVGRAAGSSTAS